MLCNLCTLCVDFFSLLCLYVMYAICIAACLHIISNFCYIYILCSLSNNGQINIINADSTHTQTRSNLSIVEMIWTSMANSFFCIKRCRSLTLFYSTYEQYKSGLSSNHCAIFINFMSKSEKRVIIIIIVFWCRKRCVHKYVSSRVFSRKLTQSFEGIRKGNLILWLLLERIQSVFFYRKMTFYQGENMYR